MELICDICGKKFTANRSDARYCSGRCRTIAYRRRTGQESAPRRRPPLRDVYRGAEHELDKAVRRLERIAEDDRWPKVRKQVNAPARLRRYRQRLSNLFVTRESPVTPENLAMPQPARRGPRRKHVQVLEPVSTSLSGLSMVLREEHLRTLDASVTPEDARKLAGEFDDAIDALSLIVAQLDKRAADRRWPATAPESVRVSGST